jgi:hypothetical protein
LFSDKTVQAPIAIIGAIEAQFLPASKKGLREIRTRFEPSSAMVRKTKYRFNPRLNGCQMQMVYFAWKIGSLVDRAFDTSEDTNDKVPVSITGVSDCGLLKN